MQMKLRQFTDYKQRLYYMSGKKYNRGNDSQRIFNRNKWLILHNDFVSITGYCKDYDVIKFNLSEDRIYEGIVDSASDLWEYYYRRAQGIDTDDLEAVEYLSIWLDLLEILKDFDRNNFMDLIDTGPQPFLKECNSWNEGKELYRNFIEETVQKLKETSKPKD